jgi:hypothetical protein
MTAVEMTDLFDKFWTEKLEPAYLETKRENPELARKWWVVGHDYLHMCADIIKQAVANEGVRMNSFWNVSSDGGGEELAEWIEKKKRRKK